MLRNRSSEILYLSVGIFLILMSIFSSDKSDFSMHDTYFVVSNSIIVLFLGITYFLFAGIVWIFSKFNRPLNKTLTWIHFLITTIAVLTSLILFGSNSSAQSVENQHDYNEFLAILMLVGFFAQFVFVINVFRAIFKRKTTNI